MTQKEEKEPRPIVSRLLPFTLALAVTALSIVLLVEGRELLIPFVIALVIWYLIDALAHGIARLFPDAIEPPGWLRLTAAIVVVAVALWLIGRLIGSSISNVADAAPTYQANLDELIRRGAALVGFDDIGSMGDIFDKVDLREIISSFAESAANVAGAIGIIIVYVIFLLVEEQSFDRKLAAMIDDDGREEEVRQLLRRIQTDIQTYVWIKTVLSVLTGAASYAVMAFVGLDFAAFWAFVIFLLNYIPTIGSLLGVIFPALIALVQFETLGPFIVIAAVLGAIQVIVGNVLEPRMMGRSLNLSPLVVILSISIGGYIWGIVGMFLGVPAMVILMIVFAHFRPTRPIAVAISGDGRIEEILKD